VLFFSVSGTSDLLTENGHIVLVYIKEINKKGPVKCSFNWVFVEWVMFMVLA
jgi:hypothetical protein